MGHSSEMAQEGSDDEITPEEVKKKAEGQKAKGNDALKAKDFKTAIRHYTMAINLDPQHTYYSNRSAAYANVQDWKNCLADAQQCISIKEDWAKDTRVGQQLLKG